MHDTKKSQWAIQEKAFLVYVNSFEEEDAYVENELEGLCEAANIEVAGSLRQRLDRPHKAFYIGTGKVEELKAHAIDAQADVVVIDAEITGSQARNLSEALSRKVIDRTQLILDIFARRAKTREGQLQVELAQLLYMMPRLMSVYTKFERQQGGIGVRGPGETKLEADRRMVRYRVARLKEEIEEIRKHRVHQRASRRKQPHKFVSIVGYTSAGKSTLMNKLADSDVLADAMPFATLDPTTRKVEFEEGSAFFLTDTVGFIRNLPTHLVAAFRATLEEAADADLILHVVDVSHPEFEVQYQAVVETLEELGVTDKPTIQVLNKTDLLPNSMALRDAIERANGGIPISALTGKGLDELMTAIQKELLGSHRRVNAVLPFDRADLVDECYKQGRVHGVEYMEDGIHVDVELEGQALEWVRRYVVNA